MDENDHRCLCCIIKSLFLDSALSLLSGYHGDCVYVLVVLSFCSPCFDFDALVPVVMATRRWESSSLFS